MWRHVPVNKAALLVFAILLLTLSISYWIVSARASQIVMDAPNLQSLIEQLDGRRRDEPSLQIFFDFHKPLLLQEYTWSIGSPDDEYNRTIWEIGSDYVCFEEIGGAAIFVRCTPFSNIVSVSWLDN